MGFCISPELTYFLVFFFEGEREQVSAQNCLAKHFLITELHTSIGDDATEVSEQLCCIL